MHAAAAASRPPSLSIKGEPAPSPRRRAGRGGEQIIKVSCPNPFASRIRINPARHPSQSIQMHPNKVTKKIKPAEKSSALVFGINENRKNILLSNIQQIHGFPLSFFQRLFRGAAERHRSGGAASWVLRPAQGSWRRLVPDLPGLCQQHVSR